MTVTTLDPNVQRRALTVGMIFAVGCVVGVLLITDLLSGGGNSLAKLARAMAVGGLISGLLNPRLGVYLLVISTAYLDLLKRMLVFYDRPTMIDLYYVLGVAPLIMGGVTGGVLVGALIGKYPVRRIHWMMLAFALSLNAVVALAEFQNGGAMKAGATVANDSFYTLLLFVVPVLFNSLEEFWKLIRFVLWVFVPVALYGVYQSIFGLSMFEIAYLKSGLTMMVKELDDIRPRPFSTLNSSGALAFACSTFFVFSLLPWIVKRGRSIVARRRWVYALLAVIFFAGTVASLARSAHIIWMIALPALFFFGTARRTIVFYMASVSSYLMLVLNADWVLKMLPVWDGYMPKGLPFLHQLTRLQTFSDRLKSFNQLKRADTYSWFGLDHEIFTHDEVTASIARFGLFPVALLALFATAFLILVHRALLRLSCPADRRVAALLLGLSAATFAGGALVGGVFGTFPNNVYWWMTIGGMLMMTLARPATEQNALVEQAQTVAQPTSGKDADSSARRRRGFPFGSSGIPSQAPAQSVRS